MAVVIKLTGSINTNFTGIQKLYEFYYEAAKYKNETIHINFYNLTFLDGNLCALFHSMLYKLIQENKLKFTTDFSFIRSKFDVLARNGFIQLEGLTDEQKSTVALQQFTIHDFQSYLNYIQDELMCHRGMKLASEDTDKIIDCFIEIFSNIEIHSQTEHPFFACGQFFPNEKTLKFTIVDLGKGFLPAIQKKTNGDVSNHKDAIIWALKKQNTTKSDAPGGMGLPTLREHFITNNGSMQIVTGDAYWTLRHGNVISRYQNFLNPCFGSMINLLFSYN